MRANHAGASFWLEIDNLLPGAWNLVRKNHQQITGLRHFQRMFDRFLLVVQRFNRGFANAVLHQRIAHDFCDFVLTAAASVVVFLNNVVIKMPRCRLGQRADIFITAITRRGKYHQFAPDCL